MREPELGNVVGQQQAVEPVPEDMADHAMGESNEPAYGGVRQLEN